MKDDLFSSREYLIFTLNQSNLGDMMHEYLLQISREREVKRTMAGRRKEKQNVNRGESET